MKITVTNQDIKRGEPGNACFCAISLALERKFGTSDVQTKINHDIERVELRIKDKFYYVNDLDEYKVSRFIDNFDNYIYDDEFDNIYPEPKPIEFEIEEAR